ncbi:hypothetical protein [Rhodoblastus sp.]|uniref:hypothetical protein n=1 Tax=Rhodoblastus sp. TaxID=1962975 RepID=UPI00263200BC|nr:hypothetical protein [Rhodoblastus sp.]
MKMRLILSAVLSCLALGAACAEDGAAGSSASPPAAYSPDLAELMVGAQLRHFKLAFAGRLQNWDLAEYEVVQLRKNFADAAHYFPNFQNVPVAKLIREYSEPALDDVSKSLKAKDSRGFQQAFNRLTEACNSCHQAAGMSFIKVRVPTASPFSNQVYKPDR